MPRLWHSPREYHAALLTFFIAVAYAAIFIFVTGLYHHRPSAEEHEIAQHLARGHGFLSPMDPSPSAPPTSWSPPIFPAIVGLAYARFGIGTLHATYVIAAVNLLCFGVVAASLIQLAIVTFDRATGVVAVVILCLNPLLMRYVPDYWDHEMALAMFFLSLALAASWGRRPLRATHAILLGVLLGLLSLTNAAYILTYPLIVLIAARAIPWRQRIRLALLALLAFLVVLAPWTIRNYHHFGRVFYVRAGAALELWNGNRPDATGYLSRAALAKHPYRDMHEHALVLSLGEPRYFDLCRQRFLTELRADPAAFVHRCFRRLGYLLLGDPTYRTPLPFVQSSASIHGIYPDRFILNTLAVLSLSGIYLTARLRPRALWPFAAAALAVTPFVVTSVNDRYALPLWTIFVFYTAILVTAIYHHLRTRTWFAPEIAIPPAAG